MRKTKYTLYFVITIIPILFFPTLVLSLDIGEISVDAFISMHQALSRPEAEGFIFLDVRPPEETAKGRLNGAIHIPINELKKRYAELPADDTDIIIYSSDGTDAETAYLTLTALGYTHVRFLRAEPIFAPDGTFTLTPLRKGEISIASFTKIVEAKPDNVVILDVRTTEEAEKGKFKDSILIPINELKQRYAELPKDKEIVIYCAVGSRAWKAYNWLKDLGYTKVRYLRSKVTFLLNGTYTITK